MNTYYRFDRFRVFRLGLGLGLGLWGLLILSADAWGRPRNSVDDLQTTEVARPRRLNPLGPSEQERSARIAEGALASRRASGRALRASGPLPPLQALYTQHHNEDKNAPAGQRRADVFYYDYAKNESIKVVVDLNTNQVAETQVGKGPAHQPFFTQAEITAALQLIFDHPDLGPGLRESYRKITGRDLAAVSQLNAEGGIYYTDPGTPLGAVTGACAEHRCMQLFIPVDDRSFIDVSNLIVDLSASEVLWINQGVSEHTH